MFDLILSRVTEGSDNHIVTLRQGVAFYAGSVGGFHSGSA